MSQNFNAGKFLRKTSLTRQSIIITAKGKRAGEGSAGSEPQGAGAQGEGAGNGLPGLKPAGNVPADTVFDTDGNPIEGVEGSVPPPAVDIQTGPIAKIPALVDPETALKVAMNASATPPELQDGSGRSTDPFVPYQAFSDSTIPVGVGVVDLSSVIQNDFGLEAVGLAPAKKDEYVQIVQKFLSQRQLKDEEIAIFQKLPSLFITNVKQSHGTIDSSEFFLGGIDSVIKATFFFRHENILRTRAQSSSRHENNGNGKMLPQTMRPETFKMTFHFLVLENQQNVKWDQIGVYLKDLIFTNFLAGVLPNNVYLETIDLRIDHPQSRQAFAKRVPFMEPGTLNAEIHKSTTRDFGFAMVNSTLSPSRNEYMLLFPFISSFFIGQGIKPVESLEIASTNFARSLSKPLGLAVGGSQQLGGPRKANLIFQLAIKTAKPGVLRTYWTVDHMTMFGFLPSRATSRSLVDLFPNEIIS